MTASDSPYAPQSATARRGRLLVIDDDVLVRVSLGHILSRDHEVTLCESGPHALDLFEEGKRFDAILCDINMPGMDGPELYDRMSVVVPDQLRRTIFLTGGAYTTRAQQFLARIDNEQMEKPFEFEALLTTLARVMD
jgi:two-component system, NtrC family, sensor kinase